jgi:filamentous hemagglutinin family protein
MLLRRHRLVLALTAVLAVPMAPAARAQSLPDAGTVTSGTAVINQAGTQMTITQTSKGAIIDWGSFNIDAGYSVIFDQQFGASSVTLNRVIGGTPSTIAGTLTANGRVFLINPSGILFSSSAQVNVGALVASTLDITNANFLAGVGSGQFVFEPMTAVGDQAIRIDAGAQLGTASAGTLAFLGRTVSNAGTLNAPGGSVLFGSAERITLDFQGDGLTMLTIRGPGIERPAPPGCPVLPCSPVLPSLVNTGTVTADGGQILMRTAATAAAAGGVILNSGTLRARGLVSRNGRIELTSDGGPVVVGVPSAGALPGSPGFLDVSGQAGGTVVIRGSDFFLFNDDANPLNPGPSAIGSEINASGATQGGTVDIQVSNLARIYSRSRISANSNGNGGRVTVRAGAIELGALAEIRADSELADGGRIDLLSGSGGLALFGGLFAGGRGAGGTITTSTTGEFDFRGLRVDAGGGTAAGTWSMALPDVTVVNGSEVGELDDIAVGNTVQDTELSYALTHGTRLVIDSADSVQFDGNVQILANSNLPLSMTVNAQRWITGDGFSILSRSGPLALRFNADAGGLHPGDGGIDFSNAVLSSNGGDILLYGQSDPGNGAASGTAIGIRLASTTLTTGGGNLLLRGASTGLSSGAGVLLGQVEIDAGTGQVNIVGLGAQAAAGVQWNSGTLEAGSVGIRGFASGDATGVDLQGVNITTSAGDISLVGVGGGRGIDLYSDQIITSGGDVVIHGRSLGVDNEGLVFTQTLVSSAGGAIDLAGEGVGGAGVDLDGLSRVDSGSGLITVRAGNDGSTDAILLQGSLTSTTGVNLRPGGVDATGVAYERVSDDIVLGAGNGFALDDAELDRISAPELVIGSNQHAGSILVQQAITRSGNLSLQNEGGAGGINLQAGIDLGNSTLTLLSGGSITQKAAAPILAHSLLVRAGGDVRLGAASNDVASSSLAGSSGGVFQFQDANGVAIGTVSGFGFNVGTGTLAGSSATGVGAAGDVLVRTLTGDLILQSGVTGGNIDLVTAGTLQNLGGASLNASGHWRVWANTWVGETRGGLAGSGPLPNYYGCTFLGPCGVTVSGTDNHFIYVQQPLAFITINDATREYGLANPVFTFAVSGMILGDLAANAIAGSPVTAATVGSNVGSYAITGNFTSPAGYAIQWQPGTLSITPATLVFTADPFQRFFGMPNPVLTGTITGFRNGDTVQSVFGGAVSWVSPAGIFSAPGLYPILGVAPSPGNYVIVQASSNATALRVLAPFSPGRPIGLVNNPPNTYLYDRNFAGAPVCAVNASLADEQLAETGDALANEWAKVRSKPNLVNCFDNERRNGCSDF